jgi:hypothetical protein
MGDCIMAKRQRDPVRERQWRERGVDPGVLRTPSADRDDVSALAARVAGPGRGVVGAAGRGSGVASFTATCQQFGLNPMAWLQNTLTQLPNTPADQIQTLLTVPAAK